jgi:hypothetical protein
MKPQFSFILSFIIGLLCIPVFNLQAQSEDSTGLPGDNFSLQGALEMFKKSSSPEEFEKLINMEGNHVNNLDLNGDGSIDYIRVVDQTGDDVHAFVLQTPISETETQDIAVIELEKTGDNTATLQIVGDEEVYGVQTIIEPIEETMPPSHDNMEPKKKSGPNQWYDESAEATIIVNVWPWPIVRFAYAPVYRPWVSPWRWSVYPGYWHPWRPLGWRALHPYHVRYYHGYGFASTHRVVRAHRIYAPHRVTSVSVRTRHAPSVNHYRVTRSKTTISGPRGKVKVSKTTTRVRKR